jgi:hypothetical protein
LRRALGLSFEIARAFDEYELVRLARVLKDPLHRLPRLLSIARSRPRVHHDE